MPVSSLPLTFFSNCKVIDIFVVQTRFETDISIHEAYVYDSNAECFVSLREWRSDKVVAEINMYTAGNATSTDTIIGRIDVKLISRPQQSNNAVSYTHLTLPTIYSV